MFFVIPFYYYSLIRYHINGIIYILNSQNKIFAVVGGGIIFLTLGDFMKPIK